MRKQLKTLLTGIAMLGIAASAHCLTITPIFDSSISSNATSGPAMMACINAAINVFQTNIADNLSISITFKVDTNVGLAQSLGSYTSVNYSNYYAALKSRATSANDTLALSRLTNTATDPVIGSNQVYMTVALAYLLGLHSSNNLNGATISFNTNLFNFTRPNPNNFNFDMQSAAEHEIDEVLGAGGAGCNLGSSPPEIGPSDLFRYTTNLVRTFTTNGDNAFFSVDGTNLWARFNQQAGADYGDWWGFAQDTNTFLPLYFALPGVTPHAEVQDAFGTPAFFSYATNFNGYPTTNSYSENTSPDLGTNELTMLDILGYTLIAQSQPPPTFKIVNSGSHQVTISWTSSVSGLALEERTNLMTGSWTPSASGTTNPAVIAVTGTQKFYKLYKPVVLSESAPNVVQYEPPTSPDVWRTHNLLPPPY